MSKIESIILRLGNDCTTMHKLHAINEFILNSSNSWRWYAKESRKGLTSSEVSMLTEALSKDPTEELYVAFSVEDKTAGIVVTDPNEESTDPSIYWITCVENLFSDSISAFSTKLSDAFTREYTISFDAAKDAMLSFSADTSAMKDCVEKLKKELSDERCKNSFGF